MPGFRPMKGFCHCCHQRRLLTAKDTGLAACPNCDAPDYSLVLANRRVFKGRRLDDDLSKELHA